MAEGSKECRSLKVSANGGISGCELTQGRVCVGLKLCTHPHIHARARARVVENRLREFPDVFYYHIQEHNIIDPLSIIKVSQVSIKGSFSKICIMEHKHKGRGAWVNISYLYLQNTTF
jgi:hypothetical protein